MERVLESYMFGPHSVNVVEYPDDEGAGYAVVMIDGSVVTEPPLVSAPGFEEVVRIYADWQATAVVS
jgi:hypothetical protein